MIQYFRNNPTLAISFWSLLLFLPFLGSTHLFDWDEINFAECAREMIVTGDYSQVMINYQAFWEKPPIFFWMQVLSMKVWGINEWGARFPNVMAGLFTLLVLFRLGKTLKNTQFGWLWVIGYSGALLPHLYFRSGIIDPWFNLFIFLAFAHLYKANPSLFFKKSENKDVPLSFSSRNAWLSGLFLGLAIMTKGPVALVVALLSYGILFLIIRNKQLLNPGILLRIALLSLLTGSIWFLALILNGRADIISEFILYQIRLFQTKDAGHGGPFFYHWLVLLIGCFPLSIPAIRSFFNRPSDPQLDGFSRWMKILFWVVLILFSIVKTKIVHYSSLCYFPLSYLATESLYRIISGKEDFKKWMKASQLIIGGILGLVLVLIPFVMMNKTYLLENNLVKDPFAAGNLEAEINWSGVESLSGFAILLSLVLFILWLKRKETLKAVLSLNLGIILALGLASGLLVNKIEGYSQRTAIDFFRSMEGKDAYLETLGYKSYAYLFYSNKKEPVDRRSLDRDWLLRGNIDKPAYFVSKNVSKTSMLEHYPDLKVIGEKNGFVFYLREIPESPEN